MFGSQISMRVLARVLLAALILGLPTYATMWADSDGSPIDGWQRWLAMGIWVALAATAAIATTGHDWLYDTVDRWAFSSLRNSQGWGTGSNGAETAVSPSEPHVSNDS